MISIPGFFCTGLWRCFLFSVFAVLLLCRTKPFLQPDLVPEVLQLVEELELVCPLGVCGGTARGGRHDVNGLGEMQRGGGKSRTISAKHSSVVAGSFQGYIQYMGTDKGHEDNSLQRTTSLTSKGGQPLVGL